MNAEQKQLLRDALIKPIATAENPDPEDLILADKIAEDDIAKIEPIIDQMLLDAAKGSIPTDWIDTDMKLDIVPDGVNAIVTIELDNGRKFRINMARTRLIETGKFIVENA